MAPKKAKSAHPSRSNGFVVLRDTTNSCSHVVPQEHVTYAKKDNLKCGTSATFKGVGEAGGGFQGTVVMAGKDSDRPAGKKAHCICL